ncbi:MAG TPA: toll/interleukin-1 receptor domain-containing protein [Terriglobia bacterium]|jgi:hypothetical protein|nr:toll/interleukin-1 receptor domain-containing protein [Terriglobia bacterium]
MKSLDEDFAKRLHADLQQSNVRCWFAPEDLKIGDKFRKRIDESIRIYDKLMVILSKLYRERVGRRGDRGCPRKGTSTK